MKFFKGIQEFDGSPRGVLTIGIFDGLHLGHQKIIEEVLQKSKSNSCPSIVYTFDPHPLELLNPQLNVRRMFPIEELKDQCSELGVDYLIVENFSEEFANLNYEAFFKQYIYKFLKPSHLTVGYDFRFGLNREGTIDQLKKWEDVYDFKVQVIQALKWDKGVISSSVLRKSVSDLDFKTFEKLTHRQFKIQGIVQKGKGLARTLGFPTINIQTQSLLPQNGVYICKVKWEDVWEEAVMNIGLNPTTDASMPNSSPTKVEIHVLRDVKPSLLGKSVEVAILSWVRDEKKFNSLDLLKQAVHQDIHLAKNYFS